MAGISDSIRKALQEFEAGEYEFSMMHACMAIDGTSKKMYPDIRKHAVRFIKMLRDNYKILGTLAIQGINLDETKWPVELPGRQAKEGMPDIAEVIYTIHRCTHGHGDELPKGFELLRQANLPNANCQTLITRGKVQLSDSVIFALIAIAVVSPVNGSLRTIESGYLTFQGHRFGINDLWGRREYFIETIDSICKFPSITLNMENMMEAMGGAS